MQRYRLITYRPCRMETKQQQLRQPAECVVVQHTAAEQPTPLLNDRPEQIQNQRQVQVTSIFQPHQMFSSTNEQKQFC